MLHASWLTAELPRVCVDDPVSPRIPASVCTRGQDRELVQGLTSARWETDILEGRYQIAIFRPTSFQVHVPQSCGTCEGISWSPCTVEFGIWRELVTGERTHPMELGLAPAPVLTAVLS